MPTLRYATRDAARRSSRGAWSALLVAAAVPVAFVGIVHAMYVGECIRLGREPIPPDDTMWPTPVLIATMLLFFAAAPAAFIQLVAAAWVAAQEWGRPRAWVGLATLAVPPLMLAILRLDPVGAFYWWFD